jgi:hypothetical protein
MEVRTAYVEEEFEWESLQVRGLLRGGLPLGPPRARARLLPAPPPAGRRAARDLPRPSAHSPPAPLHPPQRLAIRDTQEGNKKLMVARAMASLMATPGEGQALGRGLGSGTSSPMGSVDGL